jgi:SM-20-related protein
MSLSERMLSELSDQGWSFCDDFIPANLVTRLRELTEHEFSAGHLKKAGIGRGDRYRIDPQLRADYVRWIDELSGDPAVAEAIEHIHAFRQEINRSLFLGLRDIEAHLTKYPAGPGYARHIDRFSDKDSRVLSMIIYLNEDWAKTDGGELRIFSRDDAGKTAAEFLPYGGRLVTFLSNEIWHEVCKTNRERYSLTGWFLR